MTYGTAYVARIAFGAKDTQTVRAFQEAESFPGPSLLIAYSPCIAHGYDLKFGSTSRSWRWNRAIGRCIDSTRDDSTRRNLRCSLTQ